MEEDFKNIIHVQVHVPVDLTHFCIDMFMD